MKLLFSSSVKQAVRYQAHMDEINTETSAA